MGTTMTATLFGSEWFRAVELDAEDIAGLQRFFDENPEYFVIVTGKGPQASEAADEFGPLPEAFSYTKKWVIGFVDESGSMIGMAAVVSDLIAQHVWHIGLFIVATRLHGTGVARRLFEHLERWAQGARRAVAAARRRRRQCARRALLAAVRVCRCTQARRRANGRAHAYHSRDVQAARWRQPPGIPGSGRARQTGCVVTGRRFRKNRRPRPVCSHR
jgi:GNAT superfamily N-acetyltransferase